MTLTLGSLTWSRAVDRLDLLAGSTAAALSGWAAVAPEVADAVQVTEIDPELADTAAMTDAYDLPLVVSANSVLKRLLDVRKASFLPMDRAVEDSGMEYGGITPIGLPTGYKVLLDAGVAEADPEAGGTVIIGSGLRRSKIALPGSLLATMPGVEVVEGLALA